MHFANRDFIIVGRDFGMKPCFSGKNFWKFGGFDRIRNESDHIIEKDVVREMWLLKNEFLGCERISHIVPLLRNQQVTGQPFYWDKV